MSAEPRPSWWGGVVPTIVLPAAVAAVSLGGSRFAAYAEPTSRPFGALAVVLLLIGPAALVLRRVRPPLAVAVCVLVLGLYVVADYPFGPVPLATLVAVFTAVAAGWHRRVLAVVVTAMLLLGATLLLLGRPIPWSGLVLWLAWLTAFAAAGALWRARRERIAQARAVQAEEQRRRAGEERLRIAQELHDVLGHHVSLINVQAGVALFLMDDDPEQARTALTEIKRSSRELLREMRSTLGVLRGVDEQAPHHPTPGLDRLEALLDDVRGAGLPVVLRTEGPPRVLPTGTDLAAYRIVQESLTNALRHAGPASATVLLRHSGDALEIRVDDDGAGAPGEVHDGNGLVGMRERAHALGGTLETGSGPDGGFRVHARLPLVPAGPEPGPASVGPASTDPASTDPAPGDGPDTVRR
ncbi:sensor histidine kinase [Pseudonocardia sp. KRD291]|uniref:sensor histidine kinase n=1 Tax=Pseudonocardia sp. KRD291 TaxID=2792007 RepID=UPI001C4A6429|nr:sensor histidine kinase [Pseudonocardia sp. KRD291]MBW0102564.1 sensor histidine kinase [Pseudonocardia sp. KRD291]